MQTIEDTPICELEPFSGQQKTSRASAATKKNKKTLQRTHLPYFWAEVKYYTLQLSTNASGDGSLRDELICFFLLRSRAHFTVVLTNPSVPNINAKALTPLLSLSSESVYPRQQPVNSAASKKTVSKTQGFCLTNCSQIKATKCVLTDYQSLQCTQTQLIPEVEEVLQAFNRIMVAQY